jgi:hypothetical protein
MKSSKNKIFFIILILQIIFSLSIKLNLKSKEYIPDYQESETPEVIKNMFNVVKKPDPNNGYIFDQCIKEILVSKNSVLMKTFWEEVKKIGCNKKSTFKLSNFFNLASGSFEKVLVDDVQHSCREIIEKNIISVSEDESEVTQNKLREQYEVYFNCKAEHVEKTVITAFIDAHRGNAPNNLFKILNGKQ